MALTTDLPGNESRTSTHAMIVPNTAVVSTATRRHRKRQLERRDRLGRRDDLPEARPAEGWPPANTTAAIGKHDDENEKERRDEAHLQGEGR